MEHFESRLDGVNINGVFYDATSLTRTEKTYKQRVSTMGKQGTINLQPEWGFSVTIPLKENGFENPKLEDKSNFTLTAFHTNGSIEVFPNCEVLTVSESGNSPSEANSITYNCICDRPY
jgi:hypothetical protein